MGGFHNTHPRSPAAVRATGLARCPGGEGEMGKDGRADGGGGGLEAPLPKKVELGCVCVAQRPIHVPRSAPHIPPQGLRGHLSANTPYLPPLPPRVSPRWISPLRY